MGQQQGSHWVLSRYSGFLMPTCYLFVVGNGLAYALPGFALFGWGSVALGVLLLALCVAFSHKSWVIKTAFWVFILMLGGLYQNSMAFTPSRFDISHLAPQEAAVVEGIVLKREKEGRKGQIRITSANGSFAEGVLQISRTPTPLPEEGQLVRLEGKLTLPRPALFDGGFDYAAYLRTQHIAALMNNVTSVYQGQGQPPTLEGQWLQALSTLRGRISQIFKTALPSPESEVVAGVVLGSHAVPIDDDTKSQFINTGLIHLLAASGLNVGIVAGFILWITGRLKANRKTGLLIAMGGVALYTLLAGMSPSVLRAGTMLGLALLFKLLDKELSALFLLAMAATLMVLVDPVVIGSLGFQFSVLTTFGLIAMMPTLQDWLGHTITRWLAGLVLVPTVAQLWVLPLSLYHFNQFPLHSVPLNMVAVALVIPITAIGFTASGLALLWQPLGIWLIQLTWPFAKGLTLLVAWGNSLSAAQLHLASPSPWLVFGLYLVLTVAAFTLSPTLKWGSKQKWAAVLVTLVLVCLPDSFRTLAASGQHSLHLVPIGDSTHAIVLQPGQSRSPVLLLPERLGYWEGKNLDDYLKHRNIQQIAALVFWREPGQQAHSPVQDGLLPLLKGRAVTKQVYLAQITEVALRFGPFTLLNLNTPKQAGRLFQIQYPMRKQTPCLLATQVPSDSHRCPFILFKRPFGPTAFWTFSTATTRQAQISYSPNRIRLER